MEDMARLALVEQSVKDINKFSNILHELLRLINHILDNPHDKELRTIRSEALKKVLDCKAFGDYLKYIGFESVQNGFTFPNEQTLSKLRMAQAALERKISFCCGPIRSVSVTRSGIIGSQTKRPQLSPANVLSTQNSLLLKIQTLFNNMLQYEDEDLQQTAREHIPLVTLQLMALDRMREQQRKIKTGELKGHDMSFDIALLLELLGWFKHKFFTWIDQPDCTSCGGTTTFLNNASLKSKTETCRVEVYKCVECATVCKFPRYNDVRTLLHTRCGRCGEWANCFTLLCRALGYDTRYVYDTTDHVWCEVFDYDSNSWLHADPCEGKLNAPLIYTHGWGKKLSYVIAFSRDDLQDVTWRYTSDHKEVLSRRTEVSEAELVSAVLSLREHRHAQLSPARRKYLAARNLRELADLMVERQPTDYESHGRISGSKEWRTERGEIGNDKSHTFEFTGPGDVSVRYYTGPDEYRISRDGTETETVEKWANGVFEMKNVFRKVELDWQQVYLAREEDETSGSISWRLSAKGERLSFNALSVKATTAVYETGRVDWTIQFDDEEPVPAQINNTTLSFSRWFTSATLSARLSGGAGDVGWQQAQLFRQPLADPSSTLTIQATLVER
ncbi:peptide-N(4)-(N-acetyl-beta-glucosaminyl)asparagine amidase isoform X2 [Pararge aegeria]|uniref:peptide-N(4)-(N-acetyl-beta- glucosaminyl)asparagine amidase isoform X2 n=1 Tax=Pararge aegeria TaxID=116150 RepID=UPI0019D31AD6|nr:peptide-N(4)-(N-acetyl-beta-glucosaminyl)asparagine amidase isoform X2 [Pararge aegeria]